jgi:glycerol transport system substrate-binding protein
MRNLLLNTTACAAIMLATGSAHADMAAAEKFLADEIGSLSVLSEAEQKAEMEFFINAAKPFAGMEIKVVSETIATHEYESKVLAPAFTAITGIKVTHDLIGEGDVVEKLQTQMQTGENIYDAYVNDSDLIGTHWRYQQVRNLTDWMAGEGADVTSPTLDLDDFIGTSFTTGPDGKLYQLPDQQFANLYWFRYDWFNDEKNKADFKAEYGYDLGVPVNWSAYEDIAEFFTGRDLSHLGVEGDCLWQHGLRQEGPLARLALHRRVDVHGRHGRRWRAERSAGRRMGHSCERELTACRLLRHAWRCDQLARRSLCREKAIDWLQKYSPPAAAGMTFSEAGPIPAQGNVAQQMFWYTAFTAATVEPGLPVMNEDGTPKWRMAPSPHGVYWKDGQKIGYQDAGSWTLMKSTPVDRAKAAWLYAQFVTSKTVDLKKSDVGLTFIRESTINSDHFTERAPTPWRPDRVLPFAGPRGSGRRRAPTCLTIRSWRSCGGRTSAMPCPVRRAHRKRSTASAKRRRRSWNVWNAQASRVTSARR